jgi:hypothetical protein
MDQHKPWLTPGRMFARAIHPYAGAYISKNGTGIAKSRPAISAK